MKLVNVNHKGGVGKTTNSIHIGAELVNRGYKVLLIDADNQCDLTAGVGVKNPEYTIKDFLEKNKNLKISFISEKLHLLAGSSDFEAILYDRKDLSDSINIFGLDEFYDFILIDVPPTGVNSRYISPAELALCSVDFIIVPLQADMFSIKNVSGFISRILDLKKYNANLRLLGMYFTNVLTTTNVFSDYYNLLKAEQPDYVFDTYVRRDMEVIKASIQGMTIFEYNDKCRASEDFKKLVTEILEKVEKWQKL